jgi:hypothetical protein
VAGARQPARRAGPEGRGAGHRAAALGARASSNVRAHVRRPSSRATGAELYETLALGATIGGMAVLVDGLALFDELGVKAEPAVSAAGS